MEDVRFGSKADIRTAKGHVRFTLESGHEKARNDGRRYGPTHLTRRCQWRFCTLVSSQLIPASRMRLTISTAMRHRSNSNSCSDRTLASSLVGGRTTLDGI